MANIKWRDKDDKKLAAYVRKFNAKITRESNKNPDIADSGIYPAKISVKDIKSRIVTRNDFNKELRSIDRAFNKGAFDIIDTSAGFKLTKWEVKDITLAVKRINKRRRETRQKAGISEKRAKELKLNDISVEDVLKEIGKRIKQAPKNTMVDIANEKQAWTNFVKKVRMEDNPGWFEKKNAAYMKGYTKALMHELGWDKAKKIIKMIRQLGITPYQLFLINLSNDRTDIDFVYGAEGIEEKFEALMEQIPLTYEELKAGGDLE